MLYDVSARVMSTSRVQLLNERTVDIQRSDLKIFSDADKMPIGVNDIEGLVLFHILVLNSRGMET